MKSGAASSRYKVELDGIAGCRASEISGIGIKHEPFKIGVGDQANPILGRGNYEGNEITVKHAHALNGTGREFFNWFGRYIKGDTVEKRSFRLIQMTEDGKGTEAIWECIDCVPTEFNQETNKGAESSSAEAAYFTMKFKPEDVKYL